VYYDFGEIRSIISSRTKKILYVDNELDMTTTLKIALERNGFSIDIFNDPLMVLEILSNLYIDTITIPIVDRTTTQ
jgi:DNA-binding response OmpR family regulator